jgi:hypothetical protein
MESKIDEIWQQILGIDDIQLVREFAIEYELIVNPVYPMPGLENLLAACRQQDLAMGIISNAQFFTPLLFEWFLDARMEELGFDSYFCRIDWVMPNRQRCCIKGLHLQSRREVLIQARRSSSEMIC